MRLSMKARRVPLTRAPLYKARRYQAPETGCLEIINHNVALTLIKSNQAVCLPIFQYFCPQLSFRFHSDLNSM